MHDHDADVGAERGRSRIRGARRNQGLVVRAAAITVLVAIAGVAAGWWFLGGAYLHAGAPDGGAVTTVGTPRSFGIELNTTGGAARLVSAKAISAPAGMEIAFVASDLRGSEDGDLAANGIHAQPLRGTRVRGQGPDNATFVTLTVTLRREGVFRLHDLEITYRAGFRTRRLRVHMDQCLLALDPGHRDRALLEIDHAMQNDAATPSDPLVAEYVACARP
jgi:hypothetical protein